MRMRIRLPFTRRSYWWIIAKDGERTVLAGPKESLEDANALGYSMGCFFEVMELPTRDRGRAAQIVKAMRLERGEGLDKSMQKLRHERMEQ